MNRSVRSLRTWSTSVQGGKVVRYALASMVNVVVGEAVLGLSYLLFHWSALTAATVAVAAAIIPVYLLNRMWVWGRSGRPDVMREVVPFWTIAIVYGLLSVGVAQAAAAAAVGLTASRLVQTVMIMTAILIASALLWLVRFFVLDNFIFCERSRAADVARAAADASG